MKWNAQLSDYIRSKGDIYKSAKEHSRMQFVLHVKWTN